MAKYIKTEEGYKRLEDVDGMIPVVDEGSAVLVDNLTYEDYDNGNYPKCTFIVGEKYDVIINGVTYENLTCYWYDELRVIGSNDECPYYIDDNGGEDLYLGDDIETVTIIQQSVKKFYESYLPDTIARIDDVEKHVQLATDSKMDKENPIGTGSFSMNRKSGTTIGEYSHTEGYSTTASGHSSHAEGYGTIASGNFSHAEGGGAAIGIHSHAEGSATTASGYSSHAEGDGTIASGDYSHAEGCESKALGRDSHAEGYNTYASGYQAHTEGVRTMAFRKAQHIEGMYNIKDMYGTAVTDKGLYVHIVGNGTSDTSRSNAHTLDWDGVGWFQGGLQVGGKAQDDGAKNVLLEGDAIPVPETAEVGQVMRVSEVDENGKPTAWETTNLTDNIYVTLSRKYVAGTGIVSTCDTDYQVMYDAIKNNKRVICEDSIGRINIKSDGREAVCFYIYMSNGCYIYEIYNDNSVVYTMQGLVDFGRVIQETGQSTVLIMSQKAVTNVLESKADKTDIVAAPTTAEVGQTIAVSEVDENGKPVAWEAVDIQKKINLSDYGVDVFALFAQGGGTATISNVHDIFDSIGGWGSNEVIIVIENESADIYVEVSATKTGSISGINGLTATAPIYYVNMDKYFIITLYINGKNSDNVKLVVNEVN